MSLSTTFKCFCCCLSLMWRKQHGPGELPSQTLHWGDRREWASYYLRSVVLLYGYGISVFETGEAKSSRHMNAHGFPCTYSQMPLMCWTCQLDPKPWITLLLDSVFFGFSSNSPTHTWVRTSWESLSLSNDSHSCSKAHPFCSPGFLYSSVESDILLLATRDLHLI